MHLEVAEDEHGGLELFDAHALAPNEETLEVAHTDIDMDIDTDTDTDIDLNIAQRGDPRGSTHRHRHR